jgi:uncharacterized protein YjiS (DUF1127 family)
MCAGNESAFVFNELTHDQWERRRQQIIRRAEAARARALRGLLDAVLRGLRAAAWAVFAAAGNWWRAYMRRRERNAAVRELHALDDRTLKDIGINRSEIEWVVDGEDATRLRDATIEANRSRRRDATAGAGTASRPQLCGKQLIKKHAA